MSGYDDEGQLPDTQPVSRSRPEAAGRHLIRIAAIRAMAACYTPMCQMGRISSLKCRLLLFPSCYLVLRVVPAFKQ